MSTGPSPKKAKVEELSTGTAASHQGEEEKEGGEMGMRWQAIGVTEKQKIDIMCDSVFTLEAFGAGDKSSEDVLQMLKCELRSSINGSVTAATIENIARSYVFTVRYLPVMKGPHKLHITCDGNDILKSPYNVIVKSDDVSSTPIHSISGLDSPWGLALTKNGDLVVTERGRDCDSIFSPSGEKLRSFGSFGSDPGQFNLPCGVAVDDEDNIYIADYGNNRIQKFTVEGEFVKAVNEYQYWKAGVPYRVPFNCPTGIAFSSYGERLYVVDLHQACILNSDLSFVKNGRVYYKGCIGCCAGRDGEVYVVDAVDNFIEVLDCDLNRRTRIDLRTRIGLSHASEGFCPRAVGSIDDDIMVSGVCVTSEGATGLMALLEKTSEEKDGHSHITYELLEEYATSAMKYPCGIVKGDFEIIYVCDSAENKNYAFLTKRFRCLCAFHQFL